ncbi:MAG: hydrogenase maturation nickel metallochaperone HypA [Labilithrix sp.]|nr:hydrogenase maturation nickel metallochaperone HypA [Labilithrix sp.]MCW5815661.1 hydrogenase maturation nickel metallochaperone HypA [Labilithrix sp.]
MHELAIVQRVVDEVSARLGARRVVRVRLRVGALVAVVPDAMRFCFDVATQSTSLEGAALEIEPVAAKARCEECDDVFAMSDGLPLCACGSARVAILAGQELVIQDVEVA